MPRRELQTQLRGSKQESTGGCYDEQCQIELGKEGPRSEPKTNVGSRGELASPSSDQDG